MNFCKNPAKDSTILEQFLVNPRNPKSSKLFTLSLGHFRDLDDTPPKVPGHFGPYGRSSPASPYIKHL